LTEKWFMAKKKVSEVSTEQSGELIASLIEGTQFKFLEEGTGKGSLSDKPKVETPIYALNDLLGGGLPLGAILEVFGPNASGKSSFMYETLGNFQKQYSNGVAFIIDSETSTDDQRLRQLGVDPFRAPRMGAATLEDGFDQINAILKKMSGNKQYDGFPVFILWDTIAACPTRAQLNTGQMYGGGMAERARILKSALMTIFPLIEKQNVLLVLLNQVMAEIGGWRPGVTTAGGNALKHDVHLRLELNGGHTAYDESGVFPIRKYSKLSISKSKISPIMDNFPITIDITKGGVIDREESLAWWMISEGLRIFVKRNGWYEVTDNFISKYRIFWEKFGMTGRFREGQYYEKAHTDPNFIDFLQLIWLDLISETYALQKSVCEEMRNNVMTRLMMNLSISENDLVPNNEESSISQITDEGIDALSNMMEVVADGEVPEQSNDS